MKVKTFLDNEFRSFSTYDCKIKLPSLIDGFKVSQRKIIHTVINNNRRMKVEALAPFTQSFTEYHHGAVSLEGVIVKLAQTFVGSNNINYLVPEGQFGNRLKQDASSSRYIYCRGLNDEFNDIFRKEDFDIITYQIEDDQKIEPTYYLPILPAVLINGSDGIGTGFSSKILAYNPKDLRKAVEQAIDGKRITPLVPWNKGFKGKIEKIDNQTTWYGCLTIESPKKVVITELPIGYDQESYNEILEKLQEKELVRDWIDESRLGVFKFTVTLDKKLIGKSEAELITELKLINRESENITGWSHDVNKIILFDTIEEYIKWWSDFRLTKFEDRRKSLVAEVADEIDWLLVKAQFIKLYSSIPKGFSDKKKADIEKILADDKIDAKYWDRLLDIKVYNLTLEQIEKLNDQITKLQAEKAKLEKITSVEMFKEDLKKV